MKNKSTFAGVWVYLLLVMVSWCGAAHAAPGPWSDWVALNDGQQNLCKMSFRRLTTDPKSFSEYINVRYFNGYNVSIYISTNFDVVNKTDGSVKTGKSWGNELKPGQTFEDGAPYAITGKNARTTAYSVDNVRITELDMALPSDPTGAKYEVYPVNKLAQHEQQERDAKAKQQQQQADEARQKQQDEQKRQQQEQQRQQQERQKQIDAEKERQHAAANQAVAKARQEGQAMQDAAQAGLDAIAHSRQAQAALNRQSFRGQPEDTPEIKSMLRAKKRALSAAIDYDEQAETFEGQANSGAGGPAAVALAGISAQMFRNKARKERDKADDLDRKIERARKELANQNDDDQGGGNNAAQATVNYFDLGYKSDTAGDYATAMNYYQQAAAQGNDAAMSNIGVFYENGRGVAQDYTQAMQWYQKAAAQGNATAMDNIGALYYSGQGVPKDEDTAITWYKKAATQGDQAANDFLNSILGKLRFDGVYTGRFRSMNSDQAEYFLRFFPDGTAMQYVNDGHHKEVSWAWTNKLKPGTKEHAVSVTHYQLTGNTITMDFPKSALTGGPFGMSASYRTSYSGNITWVGLQLNWKQWQKHDKTGRQTFTFTPMQ